jgi:tetratricopeptide (TPR) repeat protein
LADLRRERDDAEARATGLKADRALVEALETIRANQAVHLSAARADDEYARAFLDAGLDLDRVDPAEAGAWIARRSAPLEIAAGVDDWAAQRRRARRDRADAASWRRLLAVARAADPDPWRDALRDQVEHDDVEALRRLAADPALERQTAVGVVLLARALFARREVETAVEVLRSGWRRSPQDFWINHHLGYYLSSAVDPELDIGGLGRPDEAEAFARVAVSIRPHSPIALNSLAAALVYDAKATAEGLALLRQILRASPDDARAHNNLGKYYADHGRNDLARREFMEAVRARPDWRMSRDNLAHATAGLSYPDQEREIAEVAKFVVRLMPDDVGWQYSAALITLADDPGGTALRRTVRALLGRLERTANAKTAFELARAASLVSGVADNPARMVALAECGVAGDPKAPWRLHALALAHYRAGQFEAAIRRSEEALRVGWHAGSSCRVVLALAHHRLGHAEEARSWLEKADRTSATTARVWGDAIEFRVLRREAASLIEDSGFPADPFAGDR